MRYATPMRMVLALLLLLTATTRVAAQLAQNPLTYVQAGKWPEAQAAAGSGDPLAEKLIVYYRMLAPNAARAIEIATFIRQNRTGRCPL